MARTTLRAALLGWIAVVGCTKSDLGSAPKVLVERVSMVEESASTLALVGAEGSVLGDPSVLEALVLEATDPPVRAMTGDDGSFRIRLNGTRADTVRLELFRNGLTSSPIDLVATDSGVEALPTATRTGGCLGFDDGGALLEGVLDDLRATADETATRELILDNACDAPVRIEDLRLRDGAGAWGMRVAVALPLEIAPRTRRSGVLFVDLRAATSVDAFDVLLVETSAPAPARSAVTLRGRVGPPEPCRSLDALRCATRIDCVADGERCELR